MQGNKRARAVLPALFSAFTLVCTLLGTASITAARPVAAAGNPVYLNTFQLFHSVYTRNFNPFSAAAADFTLGAIYEPLIIITNAGRGHTYPWLATGYTWMNHNQTLVITIRHGVRWSDGVPFTAKDVLFTLTYGKVNPALDQIGYPSGNVQSVNLVGSDKVAVHFKTVNTTDLSRVVSTIKIVPEHIWSKIKNPLTFTNPNPVGTGPFTQILKFTSQEYILGKNPYYWQPGRPTYDGLRVPLFTAESSADLSTISGYLDWTGDTVLQADKVYVAKDPAHFHYFYPNAAGADGLFFQDQTYPFSLVGFRKAISYAINRTLVWQIGEGGYAFPLDATGLNQEWPAWEDKSLEPQAKELATYSPTKAKALLAQLGFTWKGGQLYDPKGHKVTVTMETDAQIPDYVADMPIIQQNLQAIGLDLSVKSVSDATYESDTSRGLPDAFLKWTGDGINPYYQFDSYMSKESYIPRGQDANAGNQGTGAGGHNWERWWSPEATSLLAQYRQTTSPATQQAIVNKLQKIQMDNLPFIPIMNGVIWATYSTRRFTGWPTPSNFYAFPAPWWYPDVIKVMTSIVPAK